MASPLEQVETTLDEVPGGVLLQFWRGETDVVLAKIEMRDEDARHLLDILQRTFEVPQ